MSKMNKLKIVSSFLSEMKSLVNAKSCLKLAISDFSVFDISEPCVQTVKGLDWINKIPENEKFDLILGDLPLGMNRKEYEFRGHKLKIRQNWAELLKSLGCLEKNGVGIFLVEPMAFSSAEGAIVESTLNSAGYYVNGIFNAPQGLLPETSITPVFVIISKNQSDSIVVAELLNNSQSKTIAQNFFSNLDSGDLINGMSIPHQSYHGFHRIKIRQQIEKLETQYKEYKEYTLGELATEINYVKAGGQLVEKNNSVYIPKIRNSPVIKKLSDIIKHHNYFQLVLGDNALNEYLAAFFRSDLGRLVLQSLTSGTISHLNKRDLEQAVVALPAIEDQEQIIATHRKMYELKRAIDGFDTELALNPTSSSSILGQLDGMLEALGALTEADKVRNLIRQGESKSIEFKETLSLDVKKKTKEEYIELSALKTIVAFLNTEGGTLLVGVNDSGVVTGIDIEIDKFHKNSTDNFLLHFKNRIKTRIGEEFYPFIEYKPIKISGNHVVLLVECKESRSPCYLDNAEFYVRTNPATDKLEGPKLVEYVKNHFKQKWGQVYF